MNKKPPRRRFPAIDLNSRNLSKLHSLFWFVFLLGGGACRTVPHLAPANLSEPGWTIREGQAVWRPRIGAPELAGELLVAIQRNGETLLQFTKTPLPFVVARTTATHWQIQFVTGHREFSGFGQPPAQIGWLHLASCVAGTAPPPEWRWKKFAD